MRNTDLQLDKTREQRRLGVAVRLQGGIGDHLLGMRILHFARRKYPSAELVVYSDANGHRPQMEVARLSPHVDRVIAARMKSPIISAEEMGILDSLEDKVLQEMKSADVFLDACGSRYFLSESCRLGVPVYEILASRPAIRPPQEARREAREFLSKWPGARFLALGLIGKGPAFLSKALESVGRMLQHILQDPRVVVLNLYTTQFDFKHWPEEARRERLAWTRKELRQVENIQECFVRMVNVADRKISTVAAILKKCRYFVGIDSGLKHLAWALKVPRTVLLHKPPSIRHALRWMPDLHRAVLLKPNGSPALVDSHIRQARRLLNGEKRRSRDRGEGERER